MREGNSGLRHDFTVKKGDVMAQKKMKKRDVTKDCSSKKFILSLRRLIDALENNRDFRIQVSGERITIPAGATLSIEHEIDEDGHEVEFQLRWKKS